MKRAISFFEYHFVVAYVLPSGLMKVGDSWKETGDDQFLLSRLNYNYNTFPYCRSSKNITIKI